ncbi:MAG: guanylate kinase [Methyloligella sp.]|nr:MAG: guanylate kinase [Methyloligella sp.]
MNKTYTNSKDIERRGLMYVLSSPSGAGKTSIATKLIDQDKNIDMSISMTTRKARPGEIDGKDYIFVNEDQFNKAIENNELLEWAEVFGNFYGTPRKAVEQKLENGQDVLFDIDWQGTQQLHEKVGKDLVRLFILPPSVKVLEDRLKRRGQDEDHIVAARMKEAANQISHWAEYDYVIINENLDESLGEVQNILNAERLKRERRVGLSAFVRNMTTKME